MRRTGRICAMLKRSRPPVPAARQRSFLRSRRIATKISKLKPKFTLSTGQGGKAFGSVTNLDIHKELEGAGIVIDRHAIELDKPVKKSGKTEVTVRLHPQVITTLTITVDAGEEEQSA